MIMIGAASVADLDRYSKGIENLLRTHNYWPMIQDTEDVLRRERWNMMAETLLERRPDRYDEARPWAFIIRESAYSPVNTGMLAEWWHYRLIAPLQFAASTSNSADAYEHVRLPGSTERTMP